MKVKRFKSPDFRNRRVALLSGHIFEVNEVWTDIPEFAWSKAYSEGCISEDMVISASGLTESDNIEAALAQADFETEILSAIKQLYVNNETGGFDRNGAPKVAFVEKYMKGGKNVSAKQVREVYVKYYDELVEEKQNAAE